MTMKREEAIERLKQNKAAAEFYAGMVQNTNAIENELKDIEAIDMAIEALQAEPNKAVPPSLADVYKWERDVALSQLEEYGIGFGEKKRDDLVQVVRCKDCKHKVTTKDGEYDPEDIVCDYWATDGLTEMDFCTYGERKGGEDE